MTTNSKDQAFHEQESDHILKEQSKQHNRVTGPTTWKSNAILRPIQAKGEGEMRKMSIVEERVEVVRRLKRFSGGKKE